MTAIKVIAFDADDTLWHTEQLFRDVQVRFCEILERYAPHDHVVAHFHDIEIKNVRLFGYGVKGFTLSMIESSIEISEQKINAADIHEIVMLGKRILDAPLDLLPGVEVVLETLKSDYRLFLITKGDVLDQRNKIGKSGLEPYFEKTIVVQEKDTETYARIFDEHNIDARTLLMVGNSIKSDSLPILDLGGRAVHIPYHITAHFETVEQDTNHPDFHQLNAMSELVGLIEELRVVG